MYYITIDKENNITDLLSDEISNKHIPSEAISITEEQVNTILSNPHGFKVFKYVNSQLQEDNTRILPQLKRNACNSIDTRAEQVRQRYITVGDGQAQTYIEKANEAADFAAAGYPSDLSNYPFIQADVDAYQITAKEVADNILAKRSEWIHIGSQVERERLMGKRLISNATDEDEVDVILQDTIDSLNQL